MKTLGRWIVTFCVWIVTGPIVAWIASHFVGRFLCFMVFFAWYVVCLAAIKRLMGHGVPRSRSLPSRPPTRTDDRGPTSHRGPSTPSAPPRPSAPTRTPSFNPNQRIYGVAGAAIGESGAFSESNTNAGVVGEGKTGVILDPLVASSNAYLWHGIWWPGSETSDVDHVIAFVRRNSLGRDVLHLLCIDSKQWKRGEWSYDGEQSYRDGEPAYKIKMSNAVDSMQRMYSGFGLPCVAIGMVVIHGATRTTNMTPPGFNTEIVTDRELKQKVSALLDGASNPPERVCAKLTSELKMSEKRVLR